MNIKQYQAELKWKNSYSRKALHMAFDVFIVVLCVFFLYGLAVALLSI